MFAKRVIEPEMLDHLPPEQARPNLADLTRINRNFGGHSVILKTLPIVVRQGEAFSLLDVGAASGDTARAIHAVFPHCRITSFDYSAINIEQAPQPKVIGNAFALPFMAESFDYVLCSLFLHHFQDEQVIALLRSFYALARRAVMVFDLERSIVPYLFLPATRYLFDWKSITVRDGMISVRASFRKAELRTLAEKAGLRNIEVTAHRPAFRISLVAFKEERQD
jgi:ubiquinone/menaquinone biosynthesis C-methylase UbiE